MSQQVGFQVASLVEAPCTDWAFVGRFLHVENFVNSQRTTLAKTLAAFVALERLFLAVDVPGNIMNDRISRGKKNSG